MKLTTSIPGILIKTLGEATNSLYPIVTRLSTLPTLAQSAIRAITVSVAILPFIITIPGVISSLFSLPWLLIGVVNLAHIFSSFKGFAMMPTGPALSIFFTYPLMAVILSTVMFGDTVSVESWICLVLGFGGVLLMNLYKPEQSTEHPTEQLHITVEGIGWLLLSALTEAIMYLFVLYGSKLLDNPLISVFSTNAWAAIAMIVYYGYQLFTGMPCSIIENSNESLKLVIANLFIGIGGMGMMFASARMLPPGVFSVLSFLGVVFGFIYGIGLGDALYMKDVVGSILVVIGSIIGGRK